METNQPSRECVVTPHTAPPGLKGQRERSGNCSVKRAGRLTMLSVLLLVLGKPAMAVNFYDGGATGIGVAGDFNIGIGQNAGDSVTGDNNTAIGYYAGQDVNGSSNSATGNSAGQTVTGSNNTAIGYYAGQDVNGYDNVALGNAAGQTVTGSNNSAFGSYAGQYVSGFDNIAHGTAAGQDVTGNINSAIGSFSGQFVSGNINSAVGSYAGQTVTGDYNNAIGSYAGQYVNGYYNSAIGTAVGQYVNGNYNSAIGAFAGQDVSGSNNIAHGYSAGQTVTGADNIAVGTNAGSTITANNSISIGNNARASADNAIAIGTGNNISGSNSGAFGDPNNVSGTGSYAIGNNNTVAQDNTFVIGNSVITTQVNSIVLGNASADHAAVPVISATVGGITYSGFAGTASAANGVVSVGAAGNERQIINVAPGQITVSSTDAINGSQLFGVADGITTRINQLGNDAVTVFGGGAIYNSATGAISAPVYTINGSSYSNIETALVAVGSGWNLSAQGANSTNVGPGESVDLKNNDGNITVSKSGSGNDVTFDLNTDLNASSVTAADGFYITGGPSVTTTGINAANRIISNVANGTNGTDAVNLSQLDAVNSVAERGWDMTTGAAGTGIALGTTPETITPGEQVTYVAGNNLIVTQTGNTVNYALNPVMTGITSIDLTGGPSISSTGIAMNGDRITGLAPGISATDAVNVSQLDAVSIVASAGWNLSAQGANSTNVGPGESVDLKNNDGNITVSKNGSGNDVTFDLADNITVDSATAGNTVVDTNGVKVDDGTGSVATLTTGSLEVSSGSNSTTYGADGVTFGNGSVSLSSTGLNSGGTIISSVANGTNGTDAVNLSQLSPVISALGSGASTDPITGAVTGPAYSLLSSTGVTLTSVTNVGAALTQLNTEIQKPITFSTESGSLDRHLGQTAAFAGGADAAGVKNISTRLTGSNVEVVMTDKPVFSEATAGTVSINTGSSGKINGLGAGDVTSSSTDAINGSQLYSYAGSFMSALGGGAEIDPVTGALSGPTYNLAGGSYNTVGDALNALDSGWELTTGATGTGIASGATVEQIQPGERVTYEAGNNLIVMQTGNTVNYALNPVMTGITSIDVTGGPSISSTGINMNGDRITGISPGEISVTSTDAVNGSQLYTTNQTIVQLGNSTASSFGGGSTYNTSTSAVSAPTYSVQESSYHNVGSAINALDSNVSRLDNRVDRVGAMSAALSSIQAGTFIESCPTEFGVGGGAYNGKYALALGVNHYACKSVLFNAGAAISGGEIMGRAGVTISLETAPKKQPETESSEIDALRNVVNMQTAQIQQQNSLMQQQNSQIQQLVKRISALESRKSRR